MDFEREQIGARMAALGAETPSLEGYRDVLAYCQCSYYTVASALTFAQFIDLDKKLKDDPGSLSLEEQRLLDSVSLPCQFTAADINRTVETS